MSLITAKRTATPDSAGPVWSWSVLSSFPWSNPPRAGARRDGCDYTVGAGAFTHLRNGPQVRQNQRRGGAADSFVGAWRSLVARLLWEQEAPGSNPGAPTNHHGGRSQLAVGLFFLMCKQCANTSGIASGNRDGPLLPPDPRSSLSGALSLGDLLGGHLGGEDVAVLHPPVAVLARRLGGGEVGPHVRFDVVLRSPCPPPR